MREDGTVFYCFQTNANPVKRELLGDHLQNGQFENNYTQYCYYNLYNNYNLSDAKVKLLGLGKIDIHCQKLIKRYAQSPLHNIFLYNGCGVHLEDSSYFLFPIKFPIIKNQERIERIKELVITCAAWSLDTVKYCEELRSLEIFQVLWKQILVTCNNVFSRVLLFIDLHMFCDFYASITYKKINDRKQCSIIELISKKLRFNDKYITNISGDTSLRSAESKNVALLASNLYKKLRNGIADQVDSELLYDLKRKRNNGENAGVKLNSKEITMLECHLLMKSYNKEALLDAYLKSGRNTVAKNISELKLIVLTSGKKIKSIYGGQEGDELLIVRTVKKVRSIANWLSKTEVLQEDIKPGGKLSSEVVLEEFSFGLIESIGHNVLYLKPSKDFEIIPHYTNYNGHIELGTILHPVAEIKHQCSELLNNTVDNLKKLLGYLIFSEIKVSDLDKLNKLI